VLEIRSITKNYGKLKALDSVSLSLASGRTHVLLGSSGSGKSTILRAILGLIICDQGSIQINESSVSNMTARQRAEKIGYVPQDAGLFPHLSAQENITLVARSLSWSKNKIAERLLQLSRILSLEENLLARFPSQLSGGQKQRVALLRSLFLDPQLILMDEPFGALDPLTRAEIQNEVKSLFSRLQKTVIFVTHDVNEAYFLADHLVLMHDGRIIQEGKLEDMINHPTQAFVTKFLQAQRIFQFSGDKK
jgi:osmoprotectant transport system ATP-binding protein